MTHSNAGTAATEGGEKVGFISLGCPKALVDSERILTQLRIEGYEITPHYEEAVSYTHLTLPTTSRV